jgi:hypothetical protein
MPREATLISDETTVIINVSRGFARRMRWNYRWELEERRNRLRITRPLIPNAKNVLKNRGQPLARPPQNILVIAS